MLGNKYDNNQIDGLSMHRAGAEQWPDSTEFIVYLMPGNESIDGRAEFLDGRRVQGLMNW